MEERKIDYIEMQLKQILEYNKKQDKLISDIHKVIHGNGDPECGLIVKTTRMSEKIQNISAVIKIHWALLILVIGVAVKTAFF